MADALKIILQLVTGVLAVVVAWAALRSHVVRDRQIRDIRADLDEAERRLEELGWATHSKEER